MVRHSLKPVENRETTTHKYPEVMVVEGGERGFVRDTGFRIFNETVFNQLSNAVDAAENGKTGNKIYVKDISIRGEGAKTFLGITFMNGEHFSVSMSGDEYEKLPESSGGNVTNIARNMAQMLKAVHHKKMRVSLRAVADESANFLISDPSDVFDDGEPVIELDRIEGVHRTSLIIQHGDTNLIFSKKEASFNPDAVKSPVYPLQSTVFIVGRMPFKNTHPEYYLSILEHKKQFPGDRIYFALSTDQVESGYRKFRDFLQETDILFCNLDEACDFLRLPMPNIDDQDTRDRLAYMATNLLYALGVKSVCITDAKNGLYYGQKIEQNIVSFNQKDTEDVTETALDDVISRVLYDDLNTDNAFYPSRFLPISELTLLLEELEGVGVYVDSSRIDIQASAQSLEDEPINTTGCGDSVSSLICYLDYLHHQMTYEGIPPEERGKAGNLIGVLMSRIQFSNMMFVNPEILRAIIESVQTVTRQKLFRALSESNEKRHKFTKNTFDNVHVINPDMDSNTKQVDKKNKKNRVVCILVGAKGVGKSTISKLTRRERTIASKINSPRRIAIDNGLEVDLDPVEFVLLDESVASKIKDGDILARTKKYGYVSGYNRYDLNPDDKRDVLLHSTTSAVPSLVKDLKEQVYPDESVDIKIVLLQADTETLMQRAKDNNIELHAQQKIGLERDRLRFLLSTDLADEELLILPTRDMLDDYDSSESESSPEITAFYNTVFGISRN